MKYNELIQQIDGNINTNGNHGITGAKLNSVLNEMVSVLGDGFRIAGEIVPDSPAPTDPENGLCYIAKLPGTYENFGNVVVGEDEVAFIYYDSDNESWHKMGWSRKDFGLVIVDRSTTASFGEDEMEEIRKEVAFIIRNDPDGTDNRLFVKDSVDRLNGLICFYSAPLIKETQNGDMRLYQSFIYLSTYGVQGRYPYDVSSLDFTVPSRSNMQAALALKQNTLTFDSAPTANSTNPVTSGGIATAISGFITANVNNLVNYYKKNETYTKAEVEALIAAVHAARFEVVNSLPVTGETNVIYLLPASSPTTGNVYNEYVYVNNAWELIGSTAIDLSNYYTKTQTDNLLASKQNTLTFDTIPTTGSTNPVTSGGIKAAIDAVPRGITDYDGLENRPQIGGVTLTGNKTAAQLGLATINDITWEEN